MDTRQEASPGDLDSVRRDGTVLAQELMRREQHLVEDFQVGRTDPCRTKRCPQMCWGRTCVCGRLTLGVAPGLDRISSPSLRTPSLSSRPSV